MLDVSGYNMIQDDGAVALAEALETNEALTELWLSDNEIGDAGAFAIAKMLKVNAHMTTLHMRGNKIGPEGGKAIHEAIDTMDVLHRVEVDVNESIPPPPKKYRKGRAKQKSDEL